MKRLMDDFNAVFDLGYRVGSRSLKELVEQTVAGLDDRALDEWGTAGRREEIVTKSGRFASFHYRPHLFPDMDLKLRLAHELQFRLLPRQLPADAPVSIASVLESFCHLSGDLFGWQMLRDGRFLIWIVDMAGHGVAAGLSSAVLRILVDHSTDRGRVDVLVAELNHALHGCLRSEYSGMFATAFFIVLDRDGSAAYCSAGHPPVLVRRADGRVEELGSLSLPLGLFATSKYRSREIRFERGESLLLYTDGLVESTSDDGEAFGIERLRELLSRGFATPEALTTAIYDELAGRQDIDMLEDDVTFVAAEVVSRPSS